MVEIRFYHMEKSTLEQTLPTLLSKACAQGHKIIIKTQNTASSEALNGYLWTYTPDSFLPHGTSKDGFSQNQPIYITDNDENPNNANVLILIDGVQDDNLESYDLCCEMLNGNDGESVQAARQRWKGYKEKGYDITYWQQDERGAWQKKAG